MKHKTKFNPDNKESFFFLSENMMLQQNLSWSFGNEKADALLITSLAYITYGHNLLKKGMKSCFKLIGDKFQGHRYPNCGAEDFSRDQLVMFVSALFLRGDITEMGTYISGIKWRISDKFRLTVDLWVWMQSLRKNSGVLATIFCFMHIISISIQNRLNALIYMLCGIEQCSPEEQVNYPYRPQTDKEKIAFKIHYKYYARHLLAWQIYTSPDNFLKKTLSKLVLKGVPKWNLVMRLLLGDTITRQEVDDYKPMTGYSWQNFVAKELYNMAEIIEYHWVYSKKYDSKENVLDNDVLIYLVENNLEKVL